MTEDEMNRRLSEIPEDRLSQIRKLIDEGFGAQSIRIETGVSIRLINAVFQQMQPINIRKGK